MNRLGFLSSTASLAVVPRFLTRRAGAMLTFQLHGAYFSRQLQIDPPLDPEVFVADPTVAVGGIGLDNIEHVAGLRALTLSQPNAPLFSAQGVHLGFTSSKWVRARGQGMIAALDDGREDVILQFSDLLAFGVYSVFKLMHGASGRVYVPLDGTAKANSFKAGAFGKATLSIVSPQPIQPDAAILLVYHSDGKPHGLDRGRVGVVAHDHLIAPLKN
jgi:hypothetical protein